MKRDMILKGVLVFSIIGLFCIGLVSAGVLDRIEDFFTVGEGGGEGELPAAHEVTVTLQNVAPVVVAIYDVIDDELGAAADTVDAYSGNAAPPGPINNANITFLVSDAQGNGDLPGGAGAIVQSSSIGDLGVTSDIEVYITAPGNNPGCVGVTRLADAGSCIRDDLCTQSTGGTGCPADQMEYTCKVPLNYYDEPSLAANDWTIYVGVADSVGATDDGNDLGVEANGFDYNSKSDFGFSVINVGWAGVSVASSPFPADTDPLVLVSLGNVAYSAGSLFASNLTSGGAGYDLEVSAFSVSASDGGECAPGVTADALDDTVSVPITAGGAVVLPFGQCGAPLTTDDLYFCIHENLDTYGSFFDNAYASNVSNCGGPCVSGTPGHAWELTLT
jgi:hypothetical protein